MYKRQGYLPKTSGYFPFMAKGWALGYGYTKDLVGSVKKIGQITEGTALDKNKIHEQVLTTTASWEWMDS